MVSLAEFEEFLKTGDIGDLKKMSKMIDDKLKRHELEMQYHEKAKAAGITIDQLYEVKRILTFMGYSLMGFSGNKLEFSGNESVIRIFLDRKKIEKSRAWSVTYEMKNEHIANALGWNKGEQDE